MWATDSEQEGRIEMAEPKRPTWRARWLGQKLRELRKNKDLSISEVAERLGNSPATVNRFESGVYPIENDELRLLMTMYGVSDQADRSQLMQLAQDVAQRGWWEGLVSNQNFADYVWAESNASEIDSFQLTIYPGQIQAPEFAETLIRQGPESRSKVEMEKLLEVRLTRGQMLRKSNAPIARFLLYEGVLRQRLNTFEARHYAAQFRHLLDVVEYPNVELRYLPLDTSVQALGDVNAGFTVLKMKDEWPTLVQVETPVGAVVAETPDIDWAVAAFETLWNEGAQGERQTVDFVVKMLKEVEK
ncbi:helix-turn-helix transcriptional regulator [Glycomyces sp. A-F 0318]|uniref:helix-turn-helix domain-containing protein n=1 Tax=Glycomyces amatae TaxID=2881355 RepID=UPI001E4BA1AE|nr:helix-turn-helix transcriptional regulator [Glycomyces amatae]MCD0443561.1 helix-turn-helix transcriptional regulator [Glycomyces amatae]